MTGGNGEKENEFTGGFKPLNGKEIDVTGMPTRILKRISEVTGIDFELKTDANGKVTATPVTTVVVTSEKKSSSKK